MKVLWLIVGGSGGLIIGSVVGFIVALLIMPFSSTTSDGTYGFREMIVCLPSGAVLGLLAGALWGLK